MLIAISALVGYAIRASDGPMGTVTDVLFDDADWTIRWIVAEVGTWMTGRQLLLPPSSVVHQDHAGKALLVGLNRAQMEASPPIFAHEPVSRDLEWRLSNHYGSDRLWGEGIVAARVLAPPLSMGARFGEDLAIGGAACAGVYGDPHLRSVSDIASGRIHATDGPIGHVADLLVDDARWSIRCLVVDTTHWWPGKHVLVARRDVRAIDYARGVIELGLDRDHVKAIPPWDPIATVDEVHDRQATDREGRHGVGI